VDMLAEYRPACSGFPRCALGFFGVVLMGLCGMSCRFHLAAAADRLKCGIDIVDGLPAPGSPASPKGAHTYLWCAHRLVDPDGAGVVHFPGNTSRMTR